jgi:hypothetical protein
VRACIQVRVRRPRLRTLGRVQHVHQAQADFLYSRVTILGVGGVDLKKGSFQRKPGAGGKQVIELLEVQIVGMAWVPDSAVGTLTKTLGQDLPGGRTPHLKGMKPVPGAQLTKALRGLLSEVSLHDQRPAAGEFHRR